MTKKAVVAELQDKLGLSSSEAARQLDGVVSAVSAVLDRDRRVAIPGFGVFTRKLRPARSFRNPSTGESITSAEKEIIKFKESKA